MAISYDPSTGTYSGKADLPPVPTKASFSPGASSPSVYFDPGSGQYSDTPFAPPKSVYPISYVGPIDNQTSRRQTVQEYGATHPFNSSNPDYQKNLDNITKGTSTSIVGNLPSSLYEESGAKGLYQGSTGAGQDGSAFGSWKDNALTELPGAAANTLTTPFKNIGAQIQNTFGGKGEVNLDTFGLTPAESYSRNVDKDVSNGTAPWLAVFKQVPQVIFDTLFVTGEARRVFDSSEVNVATGNKKLAIPTNEVGTTGPRYIPADEIVKNSLSDGQKGGLYKNYDPNNPTYLKVTPTDNGFKGEIVQIKPSLAQRGYNALFGANGEPIDSKTVSANETVVDSGQIESSKVPQLQEATPKAALSLREQLGVKEPEITNTPVPVVKPSTIKPVSTDANAFTQAIATKYPAGTIGPGSGPLAGQCVVFAQAITDLPHMGDFIATKDAVIDKVGIKASAWAKDPKVGDAVVQNIGKNGHVFVVNEVLPDGKVRVSEANYNLDGKVNHSRIVDVNDKTIYGAYRGNLKVGASEAQASVTSGAADTSAAPSAFQAALQSYNGDNNTTPTQPAAPTPAKAPAPTMQEQLDALNQPASTSTPSTPTPLATIQTPEAVPSATPTDVAPEPVSTATAALPAIEQPTATSAADASSTLPTNTPEATPVKEAAGYSPARQGVPTVYHETSPKTARDLVFANMNKAGLNVASTPELALGQKGKGAKIEIDSSQINARGISKPGSNFVASQSGKWPEYEVLNAPSKLTPHIKSVVFDKPLSAKGEQQFFGLRDNWKATKEVLPDGKVKYTNPEYQATAKTPEKAPLKEAKPEVEDKTPRDAVTISLHSGINPVPTAKVFIEKDVIPTVSGGTRGAIQIFKDARNLIAPRMGAARGTVDIFMRGKGEIAKQTFLLTRALRTAEKMFNKMSEKAQVEVIRRIQNGEEQKTEALQAFADWYREMDDQVHRELVNNGVDVSYKDNHFRNLWKVIPGAPTGIKARFFGTVRNIGGSAGFLKQSTLPDVAAGIAKGGELVTTNPARLANLAWTDAYSFIFAKRMMAELKAADELKIIGQSKPVPEGWKPISDQVRRKFYKNQNVIAKDATARLLSNMLSRDAIRESAAGRGAFIVKNIYTSIELSLSGFHAVFVSLDSGISNFALGIQKIVNLGVKRSLSGVFHASPEEIKEGIKAFVDGTKDIISTPIAPYKLARLGGTTVKSIAGKPDITGGKTLAAAQKEFAASARGKWLAKNFPNHQHLVDLLFQGGLLPDMPNEYRSNTINTMREAIHSDNYIGASLRAIPALNQAVMTPLFNMYIPNLKWGFAMKQLSYEIALESKRIVDGKISELEIARRVVDSTENRFGEMNFSNLFWNRTFKSAMQLFFRSVTWKGGTIREVGAAPFQQFKEILNAAKERRAPNLMPKMSYVLALFFITGVINTIIQKLATGKYPKDLKDLMAPQIDDNGTRILTPTYVKDVLAFKRGPTNYILNSANGVIGKLAEDFNNKDYYSNEIYKQDDSSLLKAAKMAWHLHPTPFAVSSFQNSPDTSGKALSFVGVNRAPKYVENTPMQNKIYDLYNQRFGGGTKSELETKKSDTSKAYKKALAGGDNVTAAQIKEQAINDGTYTERGFGRIETNITTGTDKILFDRLPQDDKDMLRKQMSKEEKDYYGTDDTPKTTGKWGSSANKWNSGSSKWK